MQCPLCLGDARQLGGIILATPGQITGDAGTEPITGAACVDCLGLVAMMLDGLKGGKIRQLADKLIGAGAIRRR